MKFIKQATLVKINFYNQDLCGTLFFYKNIFYKNTEAEICEILRILIIFKNKPEAEILERI